MELTVDRTALCRLSRHVLVSEVERKSAGEACTRCCVCKNVRYTCSGKCALEKPALDAVCVVYVRACVSV